MAHYLHHYKSTVSTFKSRHNIWFYYRENICARKKVVSINPRIFIKNKKKKNCERFDAPHQKDIKKTKEFYNKIIINTNTNTHISKPNLTDYKGKGK